METYGYIELEFYCGDCLYKEKSHNKTVFDISIGDITIKEICDWCKVTRSRKNCINNSTQIVNLKLFHGKIWYAINQVRVFKIHNQKAKRNKKENRI